MIVFYIYFFTDLQWDEMDGHLGALQSFLPRIKCSVMFLYLSWLSC